MLEGHAPVCAQLVPRLLVPTGQQTVNDGARQVDAGGNVEYDLPLGPRVLNTNICEINISTKYLKWCSDKRREIIFILINLIITLQHGPPHLTTGVP